MNKRFAAVVNLFFGSSMALFTIITGLLMVPLYLRYFSVSVYGAWLASGNVIAMISLIEPGIATVATQKLATSYGLDDQERFAEVFGSALVLSCGFCLLILLLGLSVAPFLPGWLDVPLAQRRPLSWALACSTLGAGTSFIFYLLGAVPQAWQRTVAPGAIGLVALTTNIAAILIALYAGLGVVSLGIGPLALSLSYIACYLVYLTVVWRRIGLPRPSASFAVMKEIWLEARMLLLAKIAGTVGKYLEAPVAAFAVSNEAAAVLVLTGRVLNAVQMFADRVASSVFAGMAHVNVAPRDGSGLRIVREVMVVSTIVCGLGIGFSLGFTKPIVGLWVGNKVFGGIALLSLLALASLVSSRKDLVAALLVSMGQIRDASRWLAAESLLRVIWLLVLVFPLGIAGIPLASTLASLMTLAALSLQLMRKLHLDREVLYLPGLKGCLVSLALGSCCMFLVPRQESWLHLALLAVPFGSLLFGLNLLDREWCAVLGKTLRAANHGLQLRRNPL